MGDRTIMIRSAGPILLEGKTWRNKAFGRFFVVAD
jgi:hypothetical protein